MAGKNTAVFGIYPAYASVEGGVDALQAAGFRNTDISVLFPENEGTKDFAHKKETKAPEGAATGATSGSWLPLCSKVSLFGRRRLPPSAPPLLGEE